MTIIAFSFVVAGLICSVVCDCRHARFQNIVK